MKQLNRVLLPILFSISASVWAQTVAPTIDVDLDRYVGKWYEIARFPNKFQAKCAGDVTADYQRRSDGQLDVLNRCRKVDGHTDEALGRGRVVDPVHRARLEVRFAPDWLGWLPLVWANYWIIDLAPDYSIAAVGEPNREYLWILARSPVLPEVTYEAVVNRVTALGYDTAKLIKTIQTPAP